MRIRNAAIAGATALAVAFGGSAVATAQESSESSETQQTTETDTQNEPAEEASSSSSDYEGIFGSSQQKNSAGETEGEGSLSSDLGSQLQADKPADGRAIFGSSKENPETGETLEGQAPWAKLLYAATWIGGIASVIGLLVGPAANFIQFGPFTN